MINTINSLHTYIKTKLTHVEAPWVDNSASLAEIVASVRSAIKAVIYPASSDSTALRLTLTSAYMYLNSNSDITADIEEAICAAANCKAAADITLLTHTCRDKHTIPCSLIHQGPLGSSPLMMELTKEDNANKPQFTTALYSFIVLMVAERPEDEGKISSLTKFNNGSCLAVSALARQSSEHSRHTGTKYR